MGKRIPHKNINGVECKRCSACKEYKALNYFWRNKNTFDNFKYECIKCCNAKQNQYKHLRNAWKKRNRHQLNIYERNKMKNDVTFRTSKYIRNAIYRVLKGKGIKSKRTMEFMGCSYDFFITYLHNRFSEGMSWDNHGEWHIDLRRPCASFDLSNPEEQCMCFHYTNLQPLWAIDNIKKGAKWSP